MVVQKQQENVESGKCLGSTLTNDAGYTCKIKTMILMARTAFKKKSCHQPLDLNLTKKLVSCSIWSIHLHGAETCILRKVDQRKVLKCDVGEGWRRSVDL
jgi:hypothetical protein